MSCTINGLVKKYYTITIHHKVYDAHPHRPVHESHIIVMPYIAQSSLNFSNCFIMSSSFEFKYGPSISLPVGMEIPSPEVKLICQTH
jgi:hypothetical protein